MQISCGIIGLPNVGKSTLFSALSSQTVEAKNYPFCTIEPNTGVVTLPDERLTKIADLIKPEKVVPTVVKFVDIAGIVKGASKGEGLGNKFLGHIREVEAIVNVVRCFDDDDIVHVDKKIDPINDIEIIETELALADLATILKKQENLKKQLKSKNKEIYDKAKFLEPIINNLEKVLSDGKPASTLDLTKKEKKALSDLHLLTLKKKIYCCNVDEASLKKENDYVRSVKEYSKKTETDVITVCAKIEAEIATLETIKEREFFLNDLGLKESALNILIKKAYKLLDLKTFFTAGPSEVRAWTFKNGYTAQNCSGVIHTDFEKGFIKAEVYHYDTLLKYGSEQKVKESGNLRIEGKEYLVKDGDILFFRFNV